MSIALSLIILLLALVPAVLFVRNLSAYRLLPEADENDLHISVLIPARDEASNIGETLESILSTPAQIEVLVLDDQSSDDTSDVVEDFSKRDPRVRLVHGTTPPAGWLGKNFACYTLAKAARYPLLVFLDADVRIARSDSLARLTKFMSDSGAAFASGVPREIVGTWLERLIIPLIHFVLLGFLPLRRMRRTTQIGCAGACGQIVAVRRDDYLRIGGHGAIAGCIHEAIALCRHFRANGLRTDLFDATDTFSCRMYHSAIEVWNGFAKNAREGLGSKHLIVPATIVLLAGQVAPFVLLPFSRGLTSCILAASIVLAVLPRFRGVLRFQQSWIGALLHPLGITLLLVNQWLARCREVEWKARSCETSRHRPFISSHPVLPKSINQMR
jgi:Glycosyl transferase family 2